MANIRKRVGPRGTKWQVQIRLAGQRPITSSFDSYDEARDYARREEKASADRRALGESGSRLLGHAIARYVETVLPTKSPNTVVTGAKLLQWWYEQHGTIPLLALTADRLAQIRDALAGELDEERRPLRGPATVNRYLTALSAVLTRAFREWDWIPANPLQRVSRLPEPQGRVRFLTREEVATLLDACGAERRELRTLAAIALYTGMRQGEILGLRWGQVDLGRRLIVLHLTKNRERRGVPISDALLEELRDHPRRLDTDLLFPMVADAGRVSRDTWRGPWHRALAAAGITDFRFHDTRHTAASHLAMLGATEREIAELLGHKTLAMVKRYSHLSREHVASVLNRLGDSLAPGRQRTAAGPPAPK
jgi:integrase